MPNPTHHTGTVNATFSTLSNSKSPMVDWVSRVKMLGANQKHRSDKPQDLSGSNILIEQAKIIELGWTEIGRENTQFKEGMELTVAFLNNTKETDLQQIKVRDLVESWIPLIYIGVKGLSKNIFLDVRYLKELKSALFRKFIDGLAPYESRLSQHLQNIIADARKKHAISMFIWSLAKLPKVFRKGKGTKKLGDRLNQIYELRKWQHILKDETHERYAEAQAWLKSEHDGQLDGLENQIDQEHKENPLPRFMPSTDSLSNPCLISVQNGLEIFPLLEPQQSSMLRNKYAIGQYWKQWEQLQRKDNTGKISQVQAKILDILTKGRAFMALANNQESILYACLLAEDYLDQINESEYEFIEAGIAQDYSAWFNLILKVLLYLSKNIRHNQELARWSQRYQLLPKKPYGVERVNAQEYFALEAKLADLTWEAEDNLTESFTLTCLNLYRKIDTLVSKFVDHHLCLGLAQEMDGPRAFEDAKRWYNLRKKARGLTLLSFSKCQRYKTFKEQELRTIVAMKPPIKTPHFQAMDLLAFNIMHYRKRLRIVDSETSVETCQRLLVLLEELRQLPSLDSVGRLLEKRGHLLTSKDELELFWLFAIKNNTTMNELHTDCIGKLREQVNKHLPASGLSDRVLFEAFTLMNYFYGDLLECLKCIQQKSNETLRNEDLHVLLGQLESLEVRVVEAHRICTQPKIVKKLIDELGAQNPLKDEAVRVLVSRLKVNGTHLEDLLAEISDLYTGLHTKFEIDQHLALTLKTEDVEAIKANFGMVESIALGTIKKFASSYKLRITEQEQLITKIRKDPQVTASKELAAIITPDFLSNYKDHRGITSKAKLLLLYYYPDYLKMEFDFLALFLNFCQPTRCRQQPTYRSFLIMFKENLKDEMNLGMLRKIAGKIKELRGHRTHNYKSLFQANLSTLIHDLQAVAGDSLKFD